jgi:hypothetical protein
MNPTWLPTQLLDTQQLLMLVINLGFAAVCGILVSIHYRYYGQRLYNSTYLYSLLAYLGPTVCFIIVVVQESLALSLGLVGALSIVRFRTAIKDPEDLAYLFIAIASGIAAGSGWALTSVIGTCLLLILVHGMRRKQSSTSSYLLRVSFPKSDVSVVRAFLDELPLPAHASAAREESTIYFTYNCDAQPNAVTDWFLGHQCPPSLTWSYNENVDIVY